MPRTLITGGAGFLGSHLAEAVLATGSPCLVFDAFDGAYPRKQKLANLATALSHPRFDLREGSILDAPAVAEVFTAFRPEVVFHLAALPGVRPSVEDPVRYAEVNGTGTLHILEAARHYGVKRLVFASSSSVYGEASPPFDEVSTSTRPISPYAASKLAAEGYCHAYAHLHRLRIACLRLFTVYGPRQRPDLAIHRFLSAVRAGHPVPVYGDGSAVRDFTFCGDVIPAMLRAAELDERFSVFNLSGGTPVTVRGLLDTVGRVTGRQVLLQEHPPQPGDVGATAANLQRARDRLGYRPETALEHGIRQQWEWMLAHPEL